MHNLSSSYNVKKIHMRIDFIFYTHIIYRLSHEDLFKYVFIRDKRKKTRTKYLLRAELLSIK